MKVKIAYPHRPKFTKEVQWQFENTQYLRVDEEIY